MFCYHLSKKKYFFRVRHIVLYGTWCFMNFHKLEIVFNILHMNYLLGFLNMTFTIHLIFRSPAGMIVRPLLSTFCPCFVIIFLEKKSLFLCIAHGMALYVVWISFLKKVLPHIHCNFVFIPLFKANNCLPNSMLVIAFAWNLILDYPCWLN